MMRLMWATVWLLAVTTAIYAQGGDNREETTLILCFPKKFLKAEADPISVTLIRYGVSKDGCTEQTMKDKAVTATVEYDCKVL